MVRSRKNSAGQRGADNRNRDVVGRRGDKQGERENPDDDTFHDLRPDEDDMRNTATDEYIWPDLRDENDEDRYWQFLPNRSPVYL